MKGLKLGKRTQFRTFEDFEFSPAIYFTRRRNTEFLNEFIHIFKKVNRAHRYWRIFAAMASHLIYAVVSNI
jgi:hypothetical protein